jgi:23S rRNA pseudouridine2604 synthase
LPTNNNDKKTITIRKTAVAVDANAAIPLDRKFTTRAKDAARRGGRTLFQPAVAKDNDATTPTAPREKSDGETRRRRQPDAVANASSAPRARRETTAETRFSEPRRGGKLRDQKPLRDQSDAPPLAQVVREPDGMIRVSKLLSEQGICSRREADSYIARGWVWADDVRITSLGTRVLQTAKLRLDREAEAMQEERMTILMNKPIGYVSGQAEDGYEPASVLAVAEHQVEVEDSPFRPEHRRGLAPAGRLDIDSTGLLVLTQDGRIAKHLIGENSSVDKEYLVRVEGTLTDAGLKLLNHGLSLDGEVLKPAIVRWQNEDQLNFILREGKKRQIRRMCELVGLHVVGLKRIRIGRVKLGDLPVGKWRFLKSDEVF